MDPISAGVAAELLAAAILSATSRLGKWARLTRRHELDLESLAQTLDTSEMASAIESSDMAALTDGYRAFLSSSEFRNVIYQTTLVRAIRGPSSDIEAVRREFSALLALYEPKGTPQSESVFFGVLLQSVDQAITDAAAKGFAVSDDAYRESVESTVRSHLGAIARNLDTIARQFTSAAPIADFENLYRHQAEHRHRLVMPPNIGGSKRVPIDQIYVKPLIEQRGQSEDRTQRRPPETFDTFARAISRAVLLGDPGGGKSTLAQKLCHDLAGDSLFTGTGPRRTPFLVVLRDYGSQKQDTRCSIVEYIKYSVESRYQTPATAGAIEYLLLNGRALVIFDGLDELLDTGYRREISEDVESFANLYPSTPVLVTSRSVGYDEAPLDVNEFEVHYLSELTIEQVTEYVSKWFSLDDELSPEEQRDLADCFVSESEVVADLRNNPLMLALMCNIYKGENYIPANRPDVYEKCALMLFERWDRTRNIRYGLPFESHVRPTMMHLAYQIYANPFLQAGVTRSELEKMATSYLLEKRFDDEDEARSAARTFIDFCTGRAWVFTDVGTTSAGEGLYQFTHRTFLEYFTAGHLVRQHPTPDRLLPVLGPRVAGAEWDVVAQLAVQMEDKTAESAGEEILRGLLKTQWPGRSRYNVLSFCARCLQFLVPSSRVVKEVSKAVTEETISCLEALDLESPREQPQDCGIALGELLLASSENYAVVRSVVLSTLQDGIASHRIGAGDLAWTFPFAFHVVGGALGSARRAEWEDIVERLRSEASSQLLELARRDLPQAIAAVRDGAMSVADGLKAHGAELLLVNSPVRLVGGYFVSICEEVLHQLAWPTARGDDDRTIAIARELGNVLLAQGDAWVVDRQRVGRPSGFFPERVPSQEVPSAPLDGLALEGAGLLLVCLVTLREGVGDTTSVWDGTTSWGRLETLTGLPGVRSGDSMDDTPPHKLRACGMREASVDRLIQWAERRRELIVLHTEPPTPEALLETNASTD